jgi:hypothetical protein
MYPADEENEDEAVVAVTPMAADTARETLAYHIMRNDRVTREPVGIDAMLVRVVMRNSITEMARGLFPQLGWWDLRVENQDRTDPDVRKKHFHPFVAFGDLVVFQLDHRQDIYDTPEKVAEVRYYENLRPDLRGCWVMRVIGWNNANRSWEEWGIELWATECGTIRQVPDRAGILEDVPMPDGTTPADFVMRKYRTKTFEPVWTPTWKEQNKLFSGYGVKRDFKRFTDSSSDARPDPVSGVQVEVPNSRIAIVNFGFVEWLRLLEDWVAGRIMEEREENRWNLVFSRFDEYAEEDFQFWIQFGGYLKASKFLNMSREDPDKSVLARFLDRYEWNAATISSSSFLALRDAIEALKKQRELRAANNPRMGYLGFDHKAAMSTRVTNLVVSPGTSWLAWAYWFHQAGQGVEPNIFDPVTNTIPDKMTNYPDAVVFPTWELFFTTYLETVAGADPQSPNGYKLRLIPAVGTPYNAFLEDSMRIRFEHFLWRYIVDPQTEQWVEDQVRDHELSVSDVEKMYELLGPNRYKAWMRAQGLMNEYEEAKTADFRRAEGCYEWHVKRQLGTDDRYPANKTGGWKGYADLQGQMEKHYYSRVTPKGPWGLLLVEEDDWRYDGAGNLIVPTLGSPICRGLPWMAYLAWKEMRTKAFRRSSILNAREFKMPVAQDYVDQGYGRLFGPLVNRPRAARPVGLDEGSMPGESSADWMRRLLERRACELYALAWQQYQIDNMFFYYRSVAKGGKFEETISDEMRRGLHPENLLGYMYYDAKGFRDILTVNVRQLHIKMLRFWKGWLKAMLPQDFAERNSYTDLACSQVWEEMRLQVVTALLGAYEEIKQELSAAGADPSAMSQWEADHKALLNFRRDIERGLA